MRIWRQRWLSGHKQERQNGKIVRNNLRRTRGVYVILLNYNGAILGGYGRVYVGARYAKLVAVVIALSPLLVTTYDASRPAVALSPLIPTTYDDSWNSEKIQRIAIDTLCLCPSGQIDNIASSQRQGQLCDKINLFLL